MTEFTGDELKLLRQLSNARAEVQALDALLDLAGVPKLVGGTTIDRMRHACDELAIARALIRQLQRRTDLAERHAKALELREQQLAQSMKSPDSKEPKTDDTNPQATRRRRPHKATREDSARGADGQRRAEVSKGS